MIVRAATLRDRFAMIRMAKAFLAESGLPLPCDPAHMEATGRRFIEDADKLALVMERDGRVLGMLLAGVATSALAPVKIADELVWWVEPAARGHGVRLLRAYEAWARDQGARIVGMHAPDDEVAELYRRRGYGRTDTTWMREVR